MAIREVEKQQKKKLEDEHNELTAEDLERINGLGKLASMAHVQGSPIMQGGEKKAEDFEFLKQVHIM
jgi:hypothetical protein